MATPAVGAAVPQGAVCDCKRDLRYGVYEASGSFARVKLAVAGSGAVPKRVGLDGKRRWSLAWLWHACGMGCVSTGCRAPWSALAALLENLRFQ
jgi:hypothetical protein